MKNMLQVGCDKKNIYLLVQENIIKLGATFFDNKLYHMTAHSLDIQTVSKDQLKQL